MLTPDDMQLPFSEEGIAMLNFLMAFVMFGVALNIRIEDFRQIANDPKPVLVGAIAQFLMLPALSCLVVWVANPYPSLGLGLLLVAACPGGNVSNFISMVAKGNLALSVSLTACSTLLSVVMTPLNFNFWASLIPALQPTIKVFSLNWTDMLYTLAILIGLPVALGIWFGHQFPRTTKVIQKGINNLAVIFFVVFVIFVLAKNVIQLIDFLHFVLLLVLFHNSLVMFAGYMLARATRLPIRDRRTIAIETGIQNGGLALLIVFNFFDGLGGMALVAAWWGVWHFLSGMLLAFYWSRWKPYHNYA
ncbi:bile acid:sodium symporter family protein [Eisenibacter elegans]|uniref:bile acid:sodium symporter family protein n=1 Tax=Eisenibacter elegans TaxID=997 RepID=UPI0004100DB9|nr:bile acid:sodium symporter family protein [Eisenibacter elegans]